MRGNQRFQKFCVLAAGLAMTAGLLAVTPQVAAAVPAPIQPAPASAVTADPLPTVQIDGVVWSQAVVGNTVYAGGDFHFARPAGAKPGTQQTARNNLLAYDIRTGELITSFVPDLDGQVRSVTASPDGKRIYVVGDFAVANTQPRKRVAAYDTATGQLITSFNPSGVTSLARAVIATNSAVYVGGGFTETGLGDKRSNLAAFSAADGSVLPWNPNADYSVYALAASADGASIFAGGSFRNVGGQPAYGLAKISAAGVLDTSWAPVVRNAGPDAGIYSLRIQNNFVYGTTWHYGPGGNLEGTFKVPVGNSTLEWLTDCHGDNYSSFVSKGIVYTAGHAHYCGNMGGGFPQYRPFKFQHAQAWNDTVTGDILNDVHGYANWQGKAKGPAMVDWLPSMSIGSASKQYQAGWSVDGNDDYIVYGGEFPKVNGNVEQQGLVRFARRPIAPAKQGPMFTDGTLLPQLLPTSTTTARITWPAGFDRDSYSLSYQVKRNGVERYTTTANSNWWTLPALGFVDTDLTAGTTYNYQVTVKDGDGNTVYGKTVPLTMPATFAATTGYGQAVRANGARIYWPMNEQSGLTVNDRAASSASPPQVGVTDGQGDNGVTWNQPGAIPGDTAADLMDNNWSRVYSLGTETAPNTFTTQLWFKTTTANGGRLLGFSDLQSGDSGHRDRQIYLDNSGRLVFGVRTLENNPRTLVSPLSYRDGQWYQVTATMGPEGMALYVNGALVASRADTTQGESYLGYWRLGGDVLDGWPFQPTSRNVVGTVDEIAVYPTALTAAKIASIYQARNAPATANQPPTAAFSSTVSGLTANLDGTASTDSDGTVASYAWTFGDTGTATGKTVSHAYKAAGTYTVKLTVTDNAGATSSVSNTVTVKAPAQLVLDPFDRTMTNGWGKATTGGTWTLTTAASNFGVSSGAGAIKLAVKSGPSASLAAVSGRDVDLTTRITYVKPVTGAGIYNAAMVRRVGTSDYRAKWRVTPTGTTLYLARLVTGTETVLSSQTVPGLVVANGDVLNLRLQADGAGTTTVRVKLWKGAEPTAWNLTKTDTTAALQKAGSVSLYSYFSAPTGTAPITLRVQDFAVKQLR